ncbi:phosphate transport system substrate-binding protein [Pararobbsia alpina]|uniref:substrate-binding domain-containing protein n=1 Tax=Pararobbsia alpina TaxID=621374 RepID=UPI0039A48F00
MKHRKRVICEVVMIALSAASAASVFAGTPSLLAGGSSLVAPLIQTEIAAFPIADGAITYSPVGAGQGESAFLSNTPQYLNSGTTTYTMPVDFVNSDAALSAIQLYQYLGSSLGQVDGPLIQIPYVVTPIAIAVVGGPRRTGLALPNAGPKSVALNDNDLCGIFSGMITNWNQVFDPISQTLYTLNAPITVVYDESNSGGTDLLTRHLAAVCTSTNSRITFVEQQNFAGIFTEVNHTLPSNFVAAYGDAGMANALVSLSSAGTAGVAYLSPSFTNTFLAPSSAPAALYNLPVASLLNANSNTMEIPTSSAATYALGNAAPPTGSAASQPANWVPNVANPSAGYPISGTSQIIVSQCYANTDAANPSPAQSIVDFLTAHYGYANTSVIIGNGFDVPSAYVNAITADFLSNANNLNLDIGNATACSKIKGR